MSARVIIAELARRKRPIPCADERFPACPFFEAKSYSECGAMSVGQGPFAPLDPADRGGTESSSFCDVFLCHFCKIPQVGDGPTVHRNDDEMVDVRHHINVLICAGMTTALIADLASVPVATIRSLRRTTTRTITPATADAILSITFHPSRGRDLTPAVGARRRLRALNAMGYGDPALAHRLNIEIDVVTSMPEKGLITSELWEAVHEIYDELSMRPGPDADLREQSRAAGVVPPLGWDDDEIDNPKARSHERERAVGAVPADEVVIVRRLAGEQVPMRNCERKEILRMAYEQRWSPSVLADKLAIKYDSAVTELSRYRRALIQADAGGSGSADSSTEEIVARMTDAPTGEREEGGTGPVAAAAELTTAHNPDSPRQAEAMSDGIQSLGHRQAERADAGFRQPGECDRSPLDWRPRSTREVLRGDDWLCSCGTGSWGARIGEQATPAKAGDYPVTRSDVAWPADRDQREPQVLNGTALARMSAGNHRRACQSSRQRWHRAAERLRHPIAVGPGKPCSGSLMPVDFRRMVDHALGPAGARSCTAPQCCFYQSPQHVSILLDPQVPFAGHGDGKRSCMSHFLPL